MRKKVPTWVEGAAAWGLLVALLAAAPAASEGDSDESWIRFEASNLLSTAHGTFHQWDLREARVDLADLPGSQVVVEIDLSSVDTGNERRDDHLRTDDFFDVANFPTAEVRVHGAERIGSDAEGRFRYRASFDFDLHGVEKTLPGEFTLMSLEPLMVEGELVMNRLDFGIGTPKRFWNPMSITDEVSLRFRAELPR